MTKVLSLRLPSSLENTVRIHADRIHKHAPAVVGSILEHSIGGQYSFSTLRDVPQSLDAKLDVRLPAEFVARLHAEAERLGFPFLSTAESFCTPSTRGGWYFVQIGGRYTLAENHDQTKCA